MEKLHMVMDETDAPYEEDNCPYKRSLKNDIIMLEIYKECGLELRPDSDLAKLDAELQRYSNF